MTTIPPKSAQPAGVLPGLWPRCPDAPLIIPVAGRVHVPRELHRQGGQEQDLQPGFVLDLDRMRFAVLRDGIPIHYPQPGPGIPPPVIPLAALRVAEPGVLSDLHKPFQFRPLHHEGVRVEAVHCGNGPGVWLRHAQDWFVPTPAPQQLAQEIQRRRLRVARLGGYAADEIWQRAPSLREDGPGGPRPGRGKDTPEYPPTLTEGIWQPLPPLPTPAASPAADTPPTPAPAPTPAYPEQLPDHELVLRHSGPPLRLTVTTRRLLLSQEPLLGEPSIIDERPVPDSALSIPLVGLHVVQTGQLTGMSHRLTQHWFTPDAHTQIRLDRTDGPALWLWGPTAEWLICTSKAAELAADIRLRQQVSMRYPISSDLGPERHTWRDYPLTRPADTPHGRTLPPPPQYTPAAPTVTPPDSWLPQG